MCTDSGGDSCTVGLVLILTVGENLHRDVVSTGAAMLEKQGYGKRACVMKMGCRYRT